MTRNHLLMPLIPFVAACYTLVDADQDGYFDEYGDCDDSDPSIHPRAGEVEGNCVDEDCDGELEAGAGSGTGELIGNGGAVLCSAGTSAPRLGQAVAMSSSASGLTVAVGAPGAGDAGAAILLDVAALKDSGGQLLPIGQVTDRVVTGEHNSRLGYALALLDNPDDDEAELFIGMPGRAANGTANRGAVVMLRSTDWQGEHELSIDTQSGDRCPVSYCLVADGDGTDSPELGATLHVGFTDGVPFLLAGAPGAEGTKGAVVLQFAPFDGWHTMTHDQFVASGSTDGESLGVALSSADLDGDGVQEALLGANRRNGLNNNVAEGGAVYAVPIKNEIWENAVDPEPYLFAYCGDSGAHLGSAITAGDLDGDGNDDVVIGTRYEDPSVEDHAYVIFGDKAIFGDGPVDVCDPDAELADIHWASQMGDASDPGLTLSVGPSPDGEDALLIGQPTNDGGVGAIWVVSRDQLASGSVDLSTPVGLGDSGDDLLGASLGSGWWDGQPWVLAGAPGWSEQAGAVFLYPGGQL